MLKISSKFEDVVPIATEEEFLQMSSLEYVKTADEKSFPEVLARYISELQQRGISMNAISNSTKLSKSTISLYLSEKRSPSFDSLVALCMGMRLYYERTLFLFELENCTLCSLKPRDRILTKYLMGCAFNEEYTIQNCNEELEKNRLKALISSEEDNFFLEVLAKYILELQQKGISLDTISNSTGLSKPTISLYLSKKRCPSFDSLVSLCIGMRLYYTRTLFLFEMGNRTLCSSKPRDRILTKYLIGCAFKEECTVQNCDEELKKNNLKVLTIPKDE